MLFEKIIGLHLFRDWFYPIFLSSLPRNINYTYDRPFPTSQTSLTSFSPFLIFSICVSLYFPGTYYSLLHSFVVLMCRWLYSVLNFMLLCFSSWNCYLTLLLFFFFIDSSSLGRNFYFFKSIFFKWLSPVYKVLKSMSDNFWILCQFSFLISLFLLIFSL